ncbi:heterokaryon incompatibility protein-domain-containing protein, partial [Rhexocercosporidium sp. MPI-PUGE-AT-0058]
YTALSYTWGPPLPSAAILVDGHKFQVRLNLYTFLLASAQTMDETKLRLYWIDQLCIDQNDNNERATQVSIMDRIYSGASRTIIWLGTDDGIGRILGENVSDRVLELTFAHWTEEPADRLWLRSGKEVAWWRWLCTNSYWSRVWIVQEVLLSRNASIQLGVRLFSWATFRCAFYDLALTDASFHAQPHFDLLSWLCMESGGTIQWRGGARLESAIAMTKMQQCQDVRDTIYALLSLVRNGQRIRADYSISVKTLYKKVVQRVCSGN